MNISLHNLKVGSRYRVRTDLTASNGLHVRAGSTLTYLGYDTVNNGVQIVFDSDLGRVHFTPVEHCVNIETRRIESVD